VGSGAQASGTIDNASELLSHEFAKVNFCQEQDSQRQNQFIPYVGLVSLTGPEFTLDEDLDSPSQDAKTLHVVLDEAFDPFTGVCAVVMTDDEFRSANSEIMKLKDDLGQSGYLAGLASYKRFLTNGFHAVDDTPEISTRFIDELFKRLPGKAFIYYTDGQRRRDLSPKKTVLLLYACIIQVILLNHPRATQINLHFEHHQELDRFFPHVADLSARRTRTHATVVVESCLKGEPASLALADYILHVFGQSIQFVAYGYIPTEKYQYRNLLAIKNHVSLIYSMERGRIASRTHHW